MTDPFIEVCVEGIDGAVQAERGGADRIELCASLLEGGLTPSLGVVRATLRAVTVPVHAMIRPRGGDFLYSPLEYQTMLEDVVLMRDAGVAGVVFGCLMPDGRIDRLRTTELAAAARPARVTFHRAFDMAADLDEALEDLIACGIERVLTSGGAPDAVTGITMLRRLVTRAAGRIAILGCGGLRADSIGQVRHATGLSEMHFSAQIQIPSRMRSRRAGLAMGSAPLEHEFRALGTDPEMVRAIIAAARA
jgi:copper homeostasis protein